MKFKRYTKQEKEEMVRLYEALKNYHKAARELACAMSTVYYAVNPDKYEEHKEYVAEHSKK